MEAIYHDDSSIIAELHRIVRKSADEGKTLKAIELYEEELIALRHEIGLPQDFVPASILGVPLRFEGLSAEEWNAFDERRRNADPADALAAIFRDRDPDA